MPCASSPAPSGTQFATRDVGGLSHRPMLPVELEGARVIPPATAAMLEVASRLASRLARVRAWSVTRPEVRRGSL